MKKTIPPILVFLIITLVAGMGGVVFLFTQETDNDYLFSEEIVDKIIQEEILKEDLVNKEFSDWQTYKNDEYGFEFSYPEDWKKTGEQNITFPSINSGIFINKKIIEEEISLSEISSLRIFLTENNLDFYNDRLLLDSLMKSTNNNEIDVYHVDYIGRHMLFSRLYIFFNKRGDMVEIWLNTDKSAVGFVNDSDGLLKSVEEYNDFKKMIKTLRLIDG